ncbi:LysR family transcriptional regulator [Acidovorax sp. HDW3]|uniref:LysR family transcriptional regulator n=1 Tax=Acidovorax sp. HDW3 TaxID=2714923 RepID=UPI00140D3EF1|nr:LysR family transcriptional regulator [Acidovorax sp. HDW3]QIL43946.1 LysR family transcriptional regulator [Acidovorax sp. HDW3]
MNRLDAMNLFVRVADLGSFAAAAQQLGVARSVVTRQIAALEEYLGVKLIVRTTRKLTLTSPGVHYLAQCRTILQQIESAEADVMQARNTPRGHLRVGLPLSFGLKRIAPLLPQFLEKYPEITLSLEFTDRHMDLIDEGMDVSIRIATALDPGHIARKLGEIRLITVAAPHYLQRQGRPLQPADLLQHDCLGYSVKALNAPLVFFVDGKHYPVNVPYRLQANNGDALAEAAAQGMGVTVQPDFIVNTYLTEGTLEVVLAEFSLPPIGIYAILPSNRLMAQGVRVLMDFLAQQLGTEE